MALKDSGQEDDGYEIEHNHRDTHDDHDDRGMIIWSGKKKDGKSRAWLWMTLVEGRIGGKKQEEAGAAGHLAALHHRWK